MPGARMPTALQHVQEPGNVGIDVVVWRRERMAHARLGREMDHLGKAVIREQRRYALTIAEIKPVKPECAVAREHREACLLELGIVIGIEVVDSNNLAAIPQQALRNVKTDKSRRTSDQNWRNRHCLKSLFRSWAGPSHAIARMMSKFFHIDSYDM